MVEAAGDRGKWNLKTEVEEGLRWCATGLAFRELHNEYIIFEELLGQDEGMDASFSASGNV